MITPFIVPWQRFAISHKHRGSSFSYRPVHLQKKVLGPPPLLSLHGLQSGLVWFGSPAMDTKLCCVPHHTISGLLHLGLCTFGTPGDSFEFSLFLKINYKPNQTIQDEVSQFHPISLPSQPRGKGSPNWDHQTGCSASATSQSLAEACNLRSGAQNLQFQS